MGDVIVGKGSRKGLILAAVRDRELGLGFEVGSQDEAISDFFFSFSAAFVLRVYLWHRHLFCRFVYGMGI